MLYFKTPLNEMLEVEISELIIAGWAGRDSDAIIAHIEELKDLGVKPPSDTPLFYRVSADQLTQSPSIQVLGEETSGEVEVVLIGTDTGTFIGVGSDHTDRAAEAWSVAHSKQVCAKPVSPLVWPIDEILPHWDRLRLQADAVINGEHVRYQSGTLEGLLAPEDLLNCYGIKKPALAPGQAMFCGTLPVFGGIRPAERFEMSLSDPVLERRIEHAYNIHTLPVAS